MGDDFAVLDFEVDFDFDFDFAFCVLDADDFDALCVPLPAAITGGTTSAVDRPNMSSARSDFLIRFLHDHLSSPGIGST